MTDNLASLIQDRKLVIYEDERLIAELLQIQVVERKFGSKFDSKGYTDQCVCLAMGCFELSQHPDSSARIQVRTAAKAESLSLLNPRNPIWAKDRAMPIPDKHYYDEGRIPGKRLSRVQVDPDLEGGD